MHLHAHVYTHMYQMKVGIRWAGSKAWDGIEYMGEVISTSQLCVCVFAYV